MRPEHRPHGDPCLFCHHPASAHRVAHAADGDPCSCGLPAEQHRAATSVSDIATTQERYLKQYGRERALSRRRDPEKARARAEAKALARELKRLHKDDPPYLLGIDGEGQTLSSCCHATLVNSPDLQDTAKLCVVCELPDPSPTHLYVLIAAAPAPGITPADVHTLSTPSWRGAWDPVAKNFSRMPVQGLETKEILNWILHLPYPARLFAYSFNYNLTKMLEDLDNESLYFLSRPEDRARKGKDVARGPKPVFWEGYWLNLQGTHFTLASGGRKKDVWDVFKFYGCPFVTALREWKVGDEETHTQMQAMKEKRGAFDVENPDDVERYCLSECACMAGAAQKLIDAHVTVGLELKTFYGAGSTGGALLKKIGVKEKSAPRRREWKTPSHARSLGGDSKTPG